jgi:EmrB/QacA subfamily drug resistance transporter
VTTIANAPCEVGQIEGNRTPATSCCSGTWVLAATILGSSMVFIDGTAVNVALPVLQSSFQATSTQVQWVVEAYALFLAALLLLGGSLGDLFGRKRIFMVGVILFTASSALCGFAPNITFLALARGIQGIGGALLTPSSLAIISASFDANERGKAIGTWSGFTAITAAIGPVLGGWLVEHASWRSVFFLNLPVAVAILVIAGWHIEESYGDRTQRRIDWPGASLVTIGLAALTYGLITASARGLGSPVVAVTLAAGIIALIAFLFVESRSAAPMVPLGLFRSRNFAGANLLTLLLYGALGGALYFVPFNLIQVQGYSPEAAGASLLPFILLMFALSRWSGGLVAKVGARLPLVVGPAVAACGFALFARAGVGGSYWTTFGPAVMVLGLGMAIAVAPLTTTVMGSVGDEHAGLASGINNAVSRTAGLLSVALLGLAIVGVFGSALQRGMASIAVPPSVRLSISGQSGKLAAIALPPDIGDEDSLALTRAIDDAFVAGFRAVMIAAAVLALAAALTAAITIEGKQNAGTTRSQPAGLSESST